MLKIDTDPSTTDSGHGDPPPKKPDNVPVPDPQPTTPVA